MAIVPNLARPWQNPDLHWHGNADEVHGATPVSGEGDSGSGGVIAYPVPDPTKTWAELGGAGLNLARGFATGVGAGANIWRFADRVFVGDAAESFAGNNLGPTDSGNSWFTSPSYPGYLGVNAWLLVTSRPNSLVGDPYGGPYGVVSAFRTSDTGQGAICFGASPVADTTDGAWGMIIEMQRESGAGQCVGIEFGAKNKGNNTTITPNAQTTGVFGLWMAGGGDSAFGGASASPSTAVMVVLRNTNTWNDGIVFMRDALTSGRALSMSSEGVGGAHYLSWVTSTGATAFTIKSATAAGGAAWSMLNDTNGITFGTATANVLTVWAPVANVNGFLIYAGVAGSPPQLTITGADTDVDLMLAAKGTGTIRFGTYAAGVTAITGYITIRDAAGTLRKLGVIS